MRRHLEKKGVPNGAIGKPELEQDETGPCVLCGSKSICQCQRCGDFYCSPDCQRKDWPNHRYICFPMPPLIKASNSLQSHQNEAVEDKVPYLQRQMPNKDVPKEENQVESKETHPGVTKMPANESCVILTAFKSSNRCCIRSTNPTDQENYKKILKEIDDLGKTAPKYTPKSKNHSYALALREGKWNRVQIISKLDRRTRVYFIDYGNIYSRNGNDLREINNHLLSLPCYIHAIQLKDIQLISISPRLIERLNKYCNQEYQLILEKDNNIAGGDAKLFNWKTKALLNTEIVKMCSQFSDETKNDDADNVSNVSQSLPNNAEHRNGLEKTTNQPTNRNSHPNNGEINKTNSPKTAQKENDYKKKDSPRSSVITKINSTQRPHQIQALQPCLEPPFKICPLNENDGNSKAIITDDSYAELGYIGCLLEQHCPNLKEVSTFLRENQFTNQPYKPKLNEYCLAEFENEWYRAKVVEIVSDDKYRVVYIDFTNEMELTSKSIRRYPLSLTVPCHTTLCAIDGLPEVISQKLKDFLKAECIAFNELHIDNIRTENEVTYVESKSLLKKMHDNGLI